jgi:hypothetical protein
MMSGFFEDLVYSAGEGFCDVLEGIVRKPEDFAANVPAVLRRLGGPDKGLQSKDQGRQTVPEQRRGNVPRLCGGA